MKSLQFSFSVLATTALPPSDPESKKGFTATNFIGKLISDFLPAIFAIAGFIAIIMIIISGIQFMTSSGNPEAAAAARGRLVFALIGFALIALSFVILQFVEEQFLGPIT